MIMCATSVRESPCVIVVSLLIIFSPISSVCGMGIRMVVNYSFKIIDILNDIHNPDTVIYDIHNADHHIDHGNHHCCVVNYSFWLLFILLMIFIIQINLCMFSPSSYSNWSSSLSWEVWRLWQFYTRTKCRKFWYLAGKMTYVKSRIRVKTFIQGLVAVRLLHTYNM